MGILIVALAVLAWRRYRAQPRARVGHARRSCCSCSPRPVLGGATVEENLDEALVAAHLGLAMLLLGGLLWVWRATRPDVAGRRARRRRAAASARWRWPPPWACSARSWPAATWPARRSTGAPTTSSGDGAHHACGKEFPTCNGDFMPFGQARLVDIHLTHRAFMYLTTLLALTLVARGAAPPAEPRGGALRPGRWRPCWLLQVLVGALNVWLDEYEALIVLHLALGTLLWRPRSASRSSSTACRRPRAERRARRTEAVTA